jgi:hypothetical protein
MFFFIARRDNVVEKTIECFAYKWDAHSTEGQKVFLAGIKSRLQVSAKEYIVDFVSLSRVPAWGSMEECTFPEADSVGECNWLDQLSAFDI